MENILLPNDEVKVIKIDEDSTAGNIIIEICKNHYEIDIDNYDSIFNILSIWIVYEENNDINPSKLQLPLNPNHKLYEIKNKLKQIVKFDEKKSLMFKFRLGRNGFLLEEDEEKIEDKKLLRILYLEASDNIKKNIYPLDMKERLELLGIQYLIEKEIKSNFIQSSEPTNENIYFTLRKQAKNISYSNSFSRTKKMFYMYKNFDKKIKKVNDDSNSDGDNVDNFNQEKNLYKEYLKKCRDFISCYGGFYFEAQMERTIREALIHRKIYDKKILIFINEKGLHLINIECPKIISTIDFKKLSYKVIMPQDVRNYQKLSIQSKDNNEQKHQLFTRQVLFIDKTLKQFSSSFNEKNNKVF